MSTNYDHRISFYDQFRVITSATTSKELKMSLREEEYQQYGEPLGARQFHSVVRELRAFEKFAVSSLPTSTQSPLTTNISCSPACNKTHQNSSPFSSTA